MGDRQLLPEENPMTTATYLDRGAVARSILLLREIRANYEKIMVEFPKSSGLTYYQEHVDGLSEAIAIIESTRPR